MKNINIEQALENLIGSHIDSYDKEIFYFLKLKKHPGLEMLLDTTVKSHINIVGRSKGFEIKGSPKDIFQKISFANIITNNSNKAIIGNDNMIGNWVFETYPTKNNITGKFRYVGELPSEAGCEAMKTFVKRAIESYLYGRDLLNRFAEANEITYDLLGFPEDIDTNEVEIFIHPAFKKFLEDFRKDSE